MIGIVDYGVGNLKSLLNGMLFHEVAEVGLVSDPAELDRCDKILLPGVGAFGEAMSRLVERGFDEALKEQVSKGKYLLGICLGMQLLASKSYEGGETAGLDLIGGEVVRIDWEGVNVPHMGWNSVAHNGDDLFAGVEKGADFYFVHSYHFVPDDELSVISTTDYKETFVSSVRHDNVYGLQFHPEKSQRDGLKVLRNFMELRNG
jgi:glutamine amidotransferase